MQETAWRLTAQTGGGVPLFNPIIFAFTTDLMATGNVGKGGQQLMILFLWDHVEPARLRSLRKWPDVSEGKHALTKKNEQFSVGSLTLSGATGIMFS